MARRRSTRPPDRGEEPLFAAFTADRVSRTTRTRSPGCRSPAGSRSPELERSYDPIPIYARLDGRRLSGGGARRLGAGGGHVARHRLGRGDARCHRAGGVRGRHRRDRRSTLQPRQPDDPPPATASATASCAPPPIDPKYQVSPASRRGLHRRARRAPDRRRARRGWRRSRGSEFLLSIGRGIGEQDDRALRAARRPARRDAQRVAAAGRRGLDGQRAPGRPVRAHGQAEGVSRAGHLRRGPAPGRHPRRRDDHRGQHDPDAPIFGVAHYGAVCSSSPTLGAVPAHQMTYLCCRYMQILSTDS